MPGKIRTVLKIKFVLPRFFGGTRGDKTICFCIVQNGRTELFIYKNARLFFWHTGGNRRFESVIYHLLRGGNLCRLLRGQITVPAEHLRLERAAMVEWQNVKRSIEADGFHRSARFGSSANNFRGCRF